MSAVLEALPDLELVPDLGDGNGDHIGCYCRPHIAYCGIYDSSPLRDEDLDGTECAECRRIWQDEACPNCGCRPGDTCRLCDVEVRV